ncbi:MAG: hypothetical protein K9J06_03975 [Flavobacteriales bacterium]|nr:hypothetical protein [Flavobacteriales bacterium]
MANTTQNNQSVRLGNWLAQHVDKLEAILAVVTTLVLVLHAATDWPVGTITTVCLSSLSVIYFFTAYAVDQDDSVGPMDLFIAKLSSFGASVAVIGILFSLQNWPGATIQLMVGCGTLAAALPFVLIARSNNRGLKLFNSRTILRIIVIVAIGAMTFFSSDEVPGYNSEAERTPMENVE